MAELFLVISGRPEWRIRTQVSAAHSIEDLKFAVEKFAEAKAEVGI